LDGGETFPVDVVDEDLRSVHLNVKMQWFLADGEDIMRLMGCVAK